MRDKEEHRIYMRGYSRGFSAGLQKAEPDSGLVEHMEAEVAWYRQHGKHQERIQLDRAGVEYVIGDFSWNNNRSRPFELIEQRMDLERRIATETVGPNKPDSPSGQQEHPAP